MSRSWYNEVDRHAAGWLRALIADGLVPAGDVDERDIRDVQPSDLAGYTQCHFFAGIGGWSHALRLAGWPDERPIWTGSCPCQPFSVAGRGRRTADVRHLWPDFFRLIGAVRPAVVMGEQVAGAAGYGWFDGVRFDLACEGYASRGVDIPACAVDAPHIRSRLYWCAVADSDPTRQLQPQRCVGEQRRRAGDTDALDVGDADVSGLAQRRSERSDARAERPTAQRTDGGDGGLEHTASLGRREGRPEHELRSGRPTATRADGSFWSGAEWIACHDGKKRRAKPGVSMLAHGIPARVVKWRGLGNAIVPQVAAQVIGAFMDCVP